MNYVQKSEHSRTDAKQKHITERNPSNCTQQSPLQANNTLVSGNSPPFMEPGRWLPCPQETATGPYPKPDELNPQPPTPISLRSTVILPTHLYPILPSGHFPSCFPTKIFYVFFISPTRHKPRTPYLPLFEYPNIWRRLQITDLMKLLHLPVTSSLFGPNIFFSALFSNILNVCSSLNEWDQVSHPYRTRKIPVLSILEHVKFPFCIFYKQLTWRGLWTARPWGLRLFPPESNSNLLTTFANRTVTFSKDLLSFITAYPRNGRTEHARLQQFAAALHIGTGMHDSQLSPVMQWGF
jgi:hypothetical protein